jgi:ketosteroid isomerase-like protein
VGQVDDATAQLLTEIYDAANRGDFDALLERLAADVEWRTPTRVIRGRNSVAGWLVGWHTSYAPKHTPERFIEVGDNVIALVSISYEGREDNRPAHVWTVSEGNVTRVRIFPMREHAFEALGIEPEPPAD